MSEQIFPFDELKKLTRPGFFRLEVETPPRLTKTGKRRKARRIDRETSAEIAAAQSGQAGRHREKLKGFERRARRVVVPVVEQELGEILNGRAATRRTIRMSV